MNIKNEYKFIASVILMFCLPFFILSAHFLSGARELLTKDTLSYLELRTRTASGILSSVLSVNYDLSKITAVKDFYASTPAGKKSFLERRMRENPSVFSEFSVLNRSGLEIARAGTASLKDPKDYSKEAVFKEAAKSAQSAGAVEFGDYTPPALVLMEPVSSVKSAKPDSFLLGRLSLAYLGEIARLMGNNSWGNFGLLDGGGQIIADSMGRSIITPGLKAPPEVLKMVASASDKELTSFMSEVFFRGRTYLVSVSAVSGTKWWVYEIMDAADMPAYTSSAWAKRIVFSGILLIIIFGFITYKLAQTWLVDQEQRIE
ncbi:MAG: cache domain-containing protein [Elusimicrobia bacterium]|nr:cache domain-containing protein [Elusimicrobiota bacterium]